MKRSNRLIFLIGILLAVVAFVGIVVVAQPPPNNDKGQVPTQLNTVLAAKDIPLGATVTADMLETKMLDVTARVSTAFQDPSAVVGKVVRQDVTQGQQLSADTFALTGGSTVINTPPTKRAVSVAVDQISGVGTVIHTGDYVDMVVGFTGDKFPVITTDPNNPNGVTVVSGINNTSVKLLLQGMQVLGTLLPPPPAAAQGQQPQPSGTTSETTLNGQQEIVILAVTAQQAEVIKFAQMDGSVTLALRSAKDFEIDPATGQPKAPAPDDTSGIVLKSLVDSYGVLVPELIETVLPARSR